MVRRRRFWFWATQALTLSRVALAFLFVILTPLREMWLLAALIYAAAWLTDFLDGRLARSKAVASRFGGAMDVFGDRYLAIISLIYVAVRGVSSVAIAVILLRELFSVSMRMVQIDGKGFMMSNPKVGGLVHILIAAGTLGLVCRPQATVTTLDNLPFVAVAAFYAIYFPWTIAASRRRLMRSIRSELPEV